MVAVGFGWRKLTACNIRKNHCKATTVNRKTKKDLYRQHQLSARRQEELVGACTILSWAAAWPKSIADNTITKLH